jgi:hypothetical protein
VWWGRDITLTCISPLYIVLYVRCGRPGLFNTGMSPTYIGLGSVMALSYVKSSPWILCIIMPGVSWSNISTNFFNFFKLFYTAFFLWSPYFIKFSWNFAYLLQSISLDHFIQEESKKKKIIQNIKYWMNTWELEQKVNYEFEVWK